MVGGLGGSAGSKMGNGHNDLVVGGGWWVGLLLRSSVVDSCVMKEMYFKIQSNSLALLAFAALACTARVAS